MYNFLWYVYFIIFHHHLREFVLTVIMTIVYFSHVVWNLRYKFYFILLQNLLMKYLWSFRVNSRMSWSSLNINTFVCIIFLNDLWSNSWLSIQKTWREIFLRWLRFFGRIIPLVLCFELCFTFYILNVYTIHIFIKQFAITLVNWIHNYLGIIALSFWNALRTKHCIGPIIVV